MTYKTEFFTEADIAEVSDLLTESLPHHPISQDRLRRCLLGNSGYRADLAKVIRGRGGRIQSFAAAAMMPAKDGRKRARFMGVATAAAARGRGMAGQLYAEIETQLRRDGVQEILIDEGGIIPSGLDLRYEAAPIMFLRRIYVPASVGYDMTLNDGSAPPRRLAVPRGFILRDLVQDDVSQYDALCDREKWDWKYGGRMLSRGKTVGIIGAFHKPTGQLAAFAGYSEYVFGPTGTATEFRRKGLGSLVFWAAVKHMWPVIRKTPILIGNANIGYYARAFGCKIRGVIWRMRKDLTLDPAISKGKPR